MTWRFHDMKSRIKFSFSKILVSIVISLAILYLAPKTIENNNLLSEFLNIRTFTEVYAIDISGCSNLNQPGTTYLLTADITNSATSYCMNISANNVTLDCQGHNIDGDDLADYGIYISRSSSQTTNVTVRNCNVTDWDVANIYLYYANGNNLTNVTSTSSPYYGFYLSSSNSITISNSTANSNYYGFYLISSNSITISNSTVNSNSQSGFFISSSNNNTISNSTVNSNSQSGFYLFSSNNNTISNSTVNSNTWYGFYLSSSNSITISNSTANSNYYGFYLSSSNNNTISNSSIHNNTNYGIYLSSAGLNGANIIYNNLFNNTNNFYFTGTVYTNYWNTTKQSGTRIYSNGNQIGGNYWTNSTGNGYSDTCTDADTDGFCDSSYTLNTSNIDYLPLSNKYQLPVILSTDYIKIVVVKNFIKDSSSWSTNFSVTQGNNYILTAYYDGNEENISINTKINKSVYIGFFDTNLIGSETTYKDKFQKNYTLP